MSLPRIGRVTWTATGATALLALLLGLDPLVLQATAAAGPLVVPSAVGVPFGPPALHLTSFGELGTAYTLTEGLAALVLIAAVLLRIHRRPHTPGRTLAATWWAFALGSAAAGLLRGAATAHTAYGDASAYFTYALFGAFFGLLWGLLLGWLPALPAALAARSAPAPRPA
ncbi:hypothetical protein [Actinocorallia populi]|uniref:hypothetical protein n=1 Tax=Actinocorallia populi TaxID=2079200 RepID=UPI000D095ADB|nr:hypothetical protein [Actinocorallia populi]